MELSKLKRLLASFILGSIAPPVIILTYASGTSVLHPIVNFLRATVHRGLSCFSMGALDVGGWKDATIEFVVWVLGLLCRWGNTTGSRPRHIRACSSTGCSPVSASVFHSFCERELRRDPFKINKWLLGVFILCVAAAATAMEVLTKRVYDAT
ncbi:PREDICTED: uncharacterized protein LOC104766903 [Camelina sativa]|uniref:Uncharacterized protein LOC104766903 n=1 Tax=Camelina sativa TaxID=90675 RepID=A0ABM0XQ07_CAMSA|nr:PREDICTED: uncharacterized protein LOC104766903 [Camelina sativa]